MSVDLSWLPLMLLPLLGPVGAAVAQAGLWDGAAQEAEHCHLQAALLAAAQAGEEKQHRKRI